MSELSESVPYDENNKHDAITAAPLTRLEELKLRLEAARSQFAINPTVLTPSPRNLNEDNNGTSSDARQQHSYRRRIEELKLEKKNDGKQTTKVDNNMSTCTTTCTSPSKSITSNAKQDETTKVYNDNETEQKPSPTKVPDSPRNPYAAVAPMLSSTQSTTTTFRDLFSFSSPNRDQKENQNEEQTTKSVEEQSEEQPPETSLPPEKAFKQKPPETPSPAKKSVTSVAVNTPTPMSPLTTASSKKSVSFALYECKIEPIETAWNQNHQTCSVDVEGGESMTLARPLSRSSSSYITDEELEKSKRKFRVCLAIAFLTVLGALIGILKFSSIQSSKLQNFTD